MKRFSLCMVLILTGCSSVPVWRQSGIPSVATVESVRELGPLKFLDVIRGRDGGYSTKFQNQSVWMFGDSVMKIKGVDGSQWRSSTWCHTSDLDARDNLQDLSEPVDANGVPGEFLSFTESEALYNEEHFTKDVPEDQRSRWALWPGAAVSSPDGRKSYVFYSKIFGGPDGQWDFHSVGRSVAVWDSLDEQPIRPVFDSDAEYPTLLFPTDDIQLGDGALIDGGMLYVYGCTSGFFQWPVTVGRVPCDQALERSAWRFYAGNGEWNADWKKAVPVFEGAPMLTVSWNEYLNCYLAVYGVPLKNTIAIRTAERPEGPWSDPLAAVDCEPPVNKDQWCYSGMAHDELTREDGRIIYLSYYRETGFFEGEIRLVEVTLRKQ